MSDPYDINKLIAESKGDVPILGQQVPVLHGLPVNGGIMTVEAIQNLTEDQFRELFVAAIIGMMGGVYMPPPKVDVDTSDASLDELSEE